MASFSVSHTIPAPVDSTFDATLVAPLPTICSQRHGPIPPVTRIEGQPEPWGQPGQARTIVMGDGGRMRETLTSVARPTRFTYVLDELAGPMKALAKQVDGAWAFEPAGTGVRVTWTWDILPASPLAAPLLPVFGWFWTGFARRTLARLETYVLEQLQD